jgi:hypothetical protein
MSRNSQRVKPALTLVVEEPIAGHYYWMIVRPGWLRLSATMVRAAQGPLPTYQAAQEAGNEVLATMQAPCDKPVPSGFGGAWEIQTQPGALV